MTAPDLSPSRKALLLVIGYGNELRGDDSAGPRVARAIEELALPGVRVVIAQMLMPEFADDIAQADHVVFVDAGVNIGEVTVRAVRPQPGTHIIAHANSPEVMLALADMTFGRAPKARAITIPAEEFSFADALSAKTAAGVNDAITQIKRLAAVADR